MEKEQNMQQNFTVQEAVTVAKSSSNIVGWFQLSFLSILVLSGQSTATLLGRLYFDKGGNSKWMETLVQTVGFPILIPFYYLTLKNNRLDDERNKSPSPLMAVGLVYLVLGILLAACCMLFSVGLSYLPVSTFSLITATQLGFNAIFSFFINSHKFTPFIINSVVLLTISSALLVFQVDMSSDTKTSSNSKKRTAGFICTLFGSALFSLQLSLTQLAFAKVINNKTARALMDFIIWQAFVATLVIVIGLFASGEWKTLSNEMNRYELGKVSYLMNLIWTAFCWQIFSVGIFGLIVKASSLFANVISTLCLPVVPILAVIIFKDNMNGVKIVSMILAIWGFISYIYQHYLDDLKLKAAGNPNLSQLPHEIPLTQRA